jgi:hypothetical protein
MWIVMWKCGNVDCDVEMWKCGLLCGNVEMWIVTWKCGNVDCDVEMWIVIWKSGL